MYEICLYMFILSSFIILFFQSTKNNNNEKNIKNNYKENFCIGFFLKKLIKLFEKM